jgi:hypothetical protein
MPIDERGRPIIHAGPFESGVERERWVMVLSENGAPEYLLQEYETPHATQSGKSYVRPGRMIAAEGFYSADLPNDVRIKLYKFLGDNPCKKMEK